LADGVLGFQVVNLQDPNVPSRIGGLALRCSRVWVVGAFALLAGEAGWLHVVDVSSRSAPQRHAAYDAGGVVTSVRVVGNYAYVTSAGSGLHILDVGFATQ
jgi:hypothetical protein